MPDDPKAIVNARIAHASAIGDYQVAWHSEDREAILATWEKVKSTRAEVERLENGDVPNP